MYLHLLHFINNFFVLVDSKIIIVYKLKHVVLHLFVLKIKFFRELQNNSRKKNSLSSVYFSLGIIGFCIFSHLPEFVNSENDHKFISVVCIVEVQDFVVLKSRVYLHFSWFFDIFFTEFASIFGLVHKDMVDASLKFFQYIPLKLKFIIVLLNKNWFVVSPRLVLHIPIVFGLLHNWLENVYHLAKELSLDLSDEFRVNLLNLLPLSLADEKAFYNT